MDILIYLLSGFAFFLQILYWAVIIDVLLSWFTLLGVQIIIGPLNSITQPLYDMMRKVFPTRLGMIDLAPLLAILLIDLLTVFAVPTLTSMMK